MALLEGARFVKNNLISFGTHLLSGTSRLIDGLKNIEQVTLYSSPNKSGIVAFSLDGFSSTEVADLLNHEYDVAVRGGAHCAPLTHKFLGTSEQGLVRCSLAVQNSFREIDYFIKAIKQIASKV
jgi:selenocysteine lyase/cysteine desulfurase